MNQKERNSIAVLNTHIMYIRKSIDEIKDSLKSERKILDSHAVKLAKLEKGLNNHLEQHRSDLTKLGIIVSIIAFIISILVRFIP